jgi:3-keto-5-aminohexanoate cleavage enzyme
VRRPPVIITAALTGSRISREQTPHIPITPDEIAAEGVAAWRAGAAVVHVHVRDATGAGAQDMDAFRRVVDVLRAETDVILCLTTSGIPGTNLPTAVRVAPLSLRPEMASFDAGTIRMDAGLFSNEPEFLDALAAEAQARDVKLELECF